MTQINALNVGIKIWMRSISFAFPRDAPLAATVWSKGVESIFLVGAGRAWADDGTADDLVEDVLSFVDAATLELVLLVIDVLVELWLLELDRISVELELFDDCEAELELVLLARALVAVPDFREADEVENTPVAHNQFERSPWNACAITVFGLTPSPLQACCIFADNEFNSFLQSFEQATLDEKGAKLAPSQFLIDVS